MPLGQRVQMLRIKQCLFLRHMFVPTFAVRAAGRRRRFRARVTVRVAMCGSNFLLAPLSIASETVLQNTADSTKGAAEEAATTEAARQDSEDRPCHPAPSSFVPGPVEGEPVPVPWHKRELGMF